MDDRFHRTGGPSSPRLRRTSSTRQTRLVWPRRPSPSASTSGPPSAGRPCGSARRPRGPERPRPGAAGPGVPRGCRRGVRGSGCGRISPRPATTWATPSAPWAGTTRRWGISAGPSSWSRITRPGGPISPWSSWPWAGQPEAMPHCEEAVRLAPDVAAFRDNLGTALRSLGRLDEARAAYLEAIRLDPGLASAHAQPRAGLPPGGPDRRGAGASWRGPRSWSRAARSTGSTWPRLYEWVRQFDAAIPCWERVLELTRDDRARPHLALGGALHEEDRPDEAEAHYRDAAADRARLGRGPGRAGRAPRGAGRVRRGRGRLPGRDPAPADSRAGPCPAWRPSSAASCPTPTSTRWWRGSATRGRATGPAPGSSSPWARSSTPGAITPAPPAASARPTP